MNPILAKIEIGNCAEKITQSNISVYPLLTAACDVFHAIGLHSPQQCFNEDHNPILPFPCFRFWAPLKSPEAKAVCGIVTTQEVNGMEMIRFAVRLVPAKSTYRHMDVSGFIGMDKIGQMRAACTEHIGSQSKLLPIDSKHEQWAMSSVSAVLAVYRSGVFQPVHVSPPRDLSISRSVEWRQAREYYTVVHRRHAANVKGLAVGSVVADKTETLTAHARRAHTRILKSPRWGASMGKRIWVRACWVGPKEWQDAESKQIYRIAELNPPTQ
jgi:hypothetical protein